MQTRMIHLRLPEITLDIIDKIMDGNSITEKVRNYICSNYVSKQFLQVELEKSIQRTKYLESVLNKNPFYNTEKLSKEEKDFLVKSINMLKEKGPDFIYARTDLYNNTFHKNIPAKEFKLLLYEFNEETEKEVDPTKN